MPKKTHTPTSENLVIAVTSDQHAGGTTAVCPPSIMLDDGGSYTASVAQRWLWEKWLDYWKQVEETRKAFNARLGMVFNGDMTDGNHHGTTQIASGNPSAQAVVVNELLRIPLALKPDFIAGIRGTEAHVGPSAAFEERIFTGLRKDGWPVVRNEETGTSSHWHWTMEHQGVRLDFAHHGRVGTRGWTKGNAVLAQAADIILTHAMTNRPAPHLAVRSHMHQFVDSGSIYPTRLIQMPAFQLATAFIHRIAPGAIADVGGSISTIVDGELDVIPVVSHPDPTPTWRMP